MALLQLGTLTQRTDLFDIAFKTLRAFAGFMAESPGGAGNMLSALDLHTGPIEELILIGNRDDSELKALLKSLREEYQPNRLLIVHDPNDTTANETLPVLRESKAIGGKLTLYRCQNFSCQAPVVGVEAIRQELGK
jgi:uncharacterized protein YyaL (SSP411 family)